MKLAVELAIGLGKRQLKMLRKQTASPAAKSEVAQKVSSGASPKP
jgi:hypothetical protein